MIDLKQIILDYTPERTVTVELPTGETLTFRPHQRVSEAQTFIGQAAEWYNSLPKSKILAPAHPLADVLPESIDEAVKAYTIHKLSIEPHIDERTALEMLRAPELVSYISNQIDIGSRDISALARAEAVKTLKGKSNATSTGDAS